MSDIELRECLDGLWDRFDTPEFIADDPVSVPHMFTSPEDREIAGFISSTIAWGNRKAIVRDARAMIGVMDMAPYDFVRNATESDLTRIPRCVHRTFSTDDLRDFVRCLRRICSLYGTLGGFFQGEWRRTGDIRAVLSSFHREFLAGARTEHCRKHVSSIDRGAACKRLCMYLRWMVRRDVRGVDFGLWTDIPQSALYLPLDVHSAAVSRGLGILSRRQNDWKAVEEVTSCLRRLDPEDPVKYDFALFGAGVNGIGPDLP